MILVALLIGVVLIVAAIRNSQGALAAALVADVPAFVVWGAALFALGAIGFIPGLKPVSRGLLALVITVLVLKNWSAIQAGFAQAAGNVSTAATDKSAGVPPGGSTSADASAGAVAGAQAGQAAGSSAGSLLSSVITQSLNGASVGGGSSFEDIAAQLEVA